MVDDRYIGLALAMSSSLAIGMSFIITKKGLMDTSRTGADNCTGYRYRQNPIWWAGIAMMAVGEVANFAAYTFASAILVTPLGAVTELVGLPAPFPCSGNTNDDAEINIDDVVNVVLAFGTDDCNADVTANGVVDIDDIVLVILNFGPCPDPTIGGPS